MKTRAVTTGDQKTDMRLSNALMGACLRAGLHPMVSGQIVAAAIKELHAQGIVCTKQVSA